MRTGMLKSAASTYQNALAIDPTLYPAANDLGVLRAEGICPATTTSNRASKPRRPTGCQGEAIRALKTAVASSPDSYPYPRWNLGVINRSRGLSHFVESQRWLAAAGRADSDLRDKQPEFLFDDSLYFTTLDLSRPLPPEWHFATSAREISLTIGFGLLLIGGLAETGYELASHRIREAFMESTEGGRLSRLTLWGRRIPAAAMLVLACAAAYLIARSPTSTSEESIFVVLGVLVLALGVMRLRLETARRRGRPLAHYSWTPALVVGAAAAGLHSFTGAPVAYAPTPFTEEHRELRRFHLLGPTLLGSFAIILLIEARISAVPLAFELGFAGFIMTFSILTPVPPHDGGYFGRLARRIALGAVIILAFLIGAHVL
jgi:cellulose synthase operon protein C